MGSVVVSKGLSARGCYDSDRITTIGEAIMTMPLKEIEAEALQLPPTELDVLIAHLRAHREAAPDDTAEAVAAAWDEEVARRLDEIDRGVAEWIPGEEAFARIEAILRKAEA